MAKILTYGKYNTSVVMKGDKVHYNNVLNDQKCRRALGGRPAGSECGNSCSCS